LGEVYRSFDRAVAEQKRKEPEKGLLDGWFGPSAWEAWKEELDQLEYFWRAE
jgi:hypothetical protein